MQSFDNVVFSQILDVVWHDFVHKKLFLWAPFCSQEVYFDRDRIFRGAEFLGKWKDLGKRMGGVFFVFLVYRILVGDLSGKSLEQVGAWQK